MLFPPEQIGDRTTEKCRSKSTRFKVLQKAGTRSFSDIDSQKTRKFKRKQPTSNLADRLETTSIYGGTPMKHKKLFALPVLAIALLVLCASANAQNNQGDNNQGDHNKVGPYKLLATVNPPGGLGGF